MTSDSPLPSVIFVLGGPGSGKGTQCSLITQHFPYTHLSAGDLLREERQRPNSEFGELIAQYIREGQIVPVEITVNLIRRAMEQKIAEVAIDDVSHGRKFLIDGYPRNADNLAGWRALLDSSVHIKGCLFFDCPEEVMEQRLLKRGETSGRSDDNMESIRKRFRTYVKETMPVIEEFRGLGLLKEVKADRDVDDVWMEVKDIISNM
jgi:UMP-CMP kinase